MIHALEWVESAKERNVTIIPDSWWVIGAARGAKVKFHRRAATIAATYTAKLDVRFGWIKGHSGHQYNDMADEEANAGRISGIDCKADRRGQQPTASRNGDARHRSLHCSA